MKLSIIIVNYNVKYFLEQSLSSVMKAKKSFETEIFVVDNNSIDGSIEMLRSKFPTVKLIENKENRGFARANNQALQLAQGEFILLLNPDTIIEEDTLEKCINFMEKTPDAGGLGVKMINGKGEFLPESKRGLPLPSVAFYKIFGLSKLFPKSRKFGTYYLSYLSNDEIHSVEVLSGAFMMLRKSVLDKTGYLDEDYFMYGEDIDLSYRILKEGYRNYYYPHTKIIHYKGESTKKGTLNYVYVFYRAMQIFARKHFSGQNATFFNLLINIAIWFRASLAFVKRIAITILLPLLDFVIIYAGMLAMTQYWEQAVLAPRDSAFPVEYRVLVIPVYIMIWLLSTAFFKGYHKPIRLSQTNKGILTGTIVILLVYALLPESFRYSRAITVFGAMWTVIAMNSIRYLLHKLNIKKYLLTGSEHQKVLIIGTPQETQRANTLVHILYPKTEFSGIINTGNTKEDNLPAKLAQIKDFITIYNIKEIIFCSRNLEYKQIIAMMGELQSFRVEFKIVPDKNEAIIGSNSIHTTENIYTHSLHSLSKKENRVKKRFFDILSSVLLLVTLPLNIWIIGKKGKYCRNIFNVLSGKKSWIGYCLPDSSNSAIPPLKSGVLSPADIISLNSKNEDILKRVDEVYYQDYHFLNDAIILWKRIKDAGN